MLCAWVGGTGSRQKLRLTATLYSLFSPSPQSHQCKTRLCALRQTGEGWRLPPPSPTWTPTLWPSVGATSTSKTSPTWPCPANSSKLLPILIPSGSVGSGPILFSLTLVFTKFHITNTPNMDSQAFG